MRWSTNAKIGIVACENATYSGAWGPAAQALAVALEALPDEQRTPDATPVAIEFLTSRLLEMLSGRDMEETANEIFLENVALYRPLDERAAEIAKLVEQAGQLHLDHAKITSEEWPTYSRFRIAVPGDFGMIAVSVHVGPILPQRIQAVSLAFLDFAGT